jgi:Mrp family chromosome partitioning ATPase
MDRIRKALDLARLERAKPAADVGDDVGPISAGPKTIDGNRAIDAPLTAIVYTRTRVFTPSAMVLEANRVMNPATSDPGAVAFRMLRTQVLQRMDANNWRSLAIFSPGDRDGKTTTAINLAVSLANDRRHTVLLADFDFKQPRVAARLGLSPQSGADDVLAGTASVEESLYHPDGFDRLNILPARNSLMNSSEILAGPQSRELVNQLRGRYPERILIFDLPPVLQADDALAFAPLVECGLVVVAEGRTRRDDLARTVELLHNTPLVGTVLNRAADAPRGY